MAICIKCTNPYPDARKDLGYNTCVHCSTEQPYGCTSVNNHKTGNTIEILSKEEAARINKLQARHGYGTCLKHISS